GGGGGVGAPPPARGGGAPPGGGGGGVAPRGALGGVRHGAPGARPPAVRSGPRGLRPSARARRPGRPPAPGRHAHPDPARRAGPGLRSGLRPGAPPGLRAGPPPMRALVRAPAEGRPTLLLLPGRGGAEGDLVPLADALGPGLGVLAPRGPDPEGGGFAWFRHHRIGVPVEESLDRRLAEVGDWLAGALPEAGIAPPVVAM